MKYYKTTILGQIDMLAYYYTYTRVLFMKGVHVRLGNCQELTRNSHLLSFVPNLWKPLLADKFSTMLHHNILICMKQTKMITKYLELFLDSLKKNYIIKNPSIIN